MGCGVINGTDEIGSRGGVKYRAPYNAIKLWSQLTNNRGGGGVGGGRDFRHTFSGPSVLFSSLVIQNKIKKIC